MVADGTIVSKGEFVIAIAGANKQATSSLDVDWLLLLLAEDLPAKKVAKLAARISGKKKNQLYDRLMQLQKSK